MSSLAIGLIFLGIMVVLLLIRVPVGTCMGIVAIVGFALIVTPTAALSKVGTVPFDTMNNYNYAVIPLFVLMANLISTTGIGKSLFEFLHSCFGRIRGGLAMATVLACAVFAAISSTTVATAVTIGLVALPEMKKAGYSDELAAGSVASGGTLGVLIPPSSVFIIYSIIAQISMTRLFLAGIIPGLILAALMCSAITATCLINPNAAPKGQKYTAREVFRALLECVEVLLLIALVLGGLFIGWFTPTEAGGVGAAGALVITLARRKLTWNNFLEAIKGTLENTGMVYFIMFGAFLLNHLVAVSGIGNALASFISSLHVGYKLVTVVILFLYLLLGCFLDAMAMVLLTMPIFYPVIISLGADPYWFGVIVTLSMQLGCITPPVGMNAFVVAGLNDHIELNRVFVGCIPFMVSIILIALLLILFPGLTSWLPNLVIH